MALPASRKRTATCDRRPLISNHEHIEDWLTNFMRFRMNATINIKIIWSEKMRRWEGGQEVVSHRHNRSTNSSDEPLVNYVLANGMAISAQVIWWQLTFSEVPN